MFAKRLVSGIVLVLLALVFVMQGGGILLLVSGIISLIGLFELYRVMKIEKELVGMVGYFAVLLYYGMLGFHGEAYEMLLEVGVLMLLLAIYVLTFPKYKTEQITVAFFGFFYVAVLFSYLYQVRGMEDGAYLVWLVFLSSWGCDTCAYCTGMLLGKHKLAPVLSPKKSIEGAVGGTLGAILLGLLYAAVFGSQMTEFTNPLFACGTACGIAAVISQIGDLAASAIKRNHNIKDYGKLIPGHGGILDRFDSMLFTAPAIYFALLFLH